MAPFLGSSAEERTELIEKQAGLEEGSLPGVPIIGAGYNPFTGYANPVYVLASNIFDWAAAPKDSYTYLNKIYSKPVAITALDLSMSGISITTGEDIQSYQQNIAASVNIGGSYNTFSGSLATEFSAESLTKSDSSFSRCQQNISTWGLRLTINDRTRDLLNPDFRKVLDNLNTTEPKSCNDFFDKYGPYILTGVVIGGRAVRTASTNKYTVNRDYSLGVTAQESFKFATAQADATEKAKYSNAVSSFDSVSNTLETADGGDPDLGAQIFSDNSTFMAWRKTVIDHPIFVDFLSANALSPIWDLCAPDAAGQKAKADLAAYFTNQWAPAKSDALTLRPDYIDALTVVTGDDSNVAPTEGYQKLGYDLNSTVGGKFIYLCYHKTSFKPFGQSKNAVTDLRVIYDNDPTPDGYTKIPVDLNQGAKGSFVYLCYKVGSYDQNTAILSVTAFGGNDASVSAPYGYVKIDSDLNRGAGGNFIYFGYAKRD